MKKESVTVAVYMPKHLHEAAVAEAQRRGLTLGALIKSYLASFLPKK